ncbi:MAG: SH3 domain-containing protein [Candidatus Margulisbacteria bacterium]|nr:SH3 domain-containing protein [Candidatus Margulisiibacteriota bacterium]
MKKIIIFIAMSFVFAASPFYDSSVYITSSQLNIRSLPSLDSEIAIIAKRNMAFKYIETVTSGDVSWYKIEYYDPEKYDIYYKKTTAQAINPLNFSTMMEIYTETDSNSMMTQIMPTKRNFKYDNTKTEDKGWQTMRVYAPQIAYIAASYATKINRPYFLVELALEESDRYGWSYSTRQRVLNGELSRDMSPAMVRAIKGEPDNVYEDKTGRKLYYTWIYGGQAVNFKNNRVTTW